MAEGLKDWFQRGEQALAARFVALLETMPVLTLEPATLDAWADGLTIAERATLVEGALSLEVLLRDEPVFPGTERLHEAAEGQRTRAAARFCAMVVVRSASLSAGDRLRIARRQPDGQREP